jgi:hypothetical protein
LELKIKKLFKNWGQKLGQKWGQKRGQKRGSKMGSKNLKKYQNLKVKMVKDSGISKLGV